MTDAALWVGVVVIVQSGVERCGGVFSSSSNSRGGLLVQVNSTGLVVVTFTMCDGRPGLRLFLLMELGYYGVNL